MRAVLLARCLVPAALLLGGAASAQPTDKAALAEALFQEANALVEAGKSSDACPKFLASHKADPSYGAVLNLAECYLLTGKTASAWAAFLEAAGFAQKNHETARFTEATRRARALEPSLVRLIIVMKSPSPGVLVLRDGVDVDPAALGAAVPVDPGAHRIEATAPGKKAFSITTQTPGEGHTVTVEIPPLADLDLAAPAPTSTAGPDRSANTGLGAQRTLAIAAAALGLAGAGAGTGLGLMARSRWESVSAGCDAAGRCTTSAAVVTGNEARTLASGATAGFAVGGAALAAALVLWLTAPSAATAPPPQAKPAARLSGFIHPEGGGLVVNGRF